jgi:hypothetical protein
MGGLDLFVYFRVFRGQAFPLLSFSVVKLFRC